jgi:hypothetical protein
MTMALDALGKEIGKESLRNIAAIAKHFAL